MYLKSVSVISDKPSYEDWITVNNRTAINKVEVLVTAPEGDDYIGEFVTIQIEFDGTNEENGQHTASVSLDVTVTDADDTVLILMATTSPMPCHSNR